MMWKSSSLIIHIKQYIDLNFAKHFLFGKAIFEWASTIQWHHHAYLVVRTWGDNASTWGCILNDPFIQVWDWAKRKNARTIYIYIIINWVFAELLLIFGRVSELTSLTERRQNSHHVYFSYLAKSTTLCFYCEYTQK